MNHARNIVIFLWLALIASFVRNIGLSDGFFAIFNSVFLLFIGFVLLGVTVLYFALRKWLRAKTAAEPSRNFLKFRKVLRCIPVIPAILLFVFNYYKEYGDYVKMYRDMSPTRAEHFMDALGGTLDLTFVIYAAFELLLFALLWQKRKGQAAA
ncbi:hypothetical protein D3P08_13930 [Paenibacillus nanensis]|uniref:Uncharacterized protein n=1 Tax=Paenibacillus nanensis TaxID=393251 RepID=A0A3A1V0D6_9BACL|nr:hypothetical protein [Paenibacillus nanensis]RIX52073.1 hypothetical protein D3P08_13930 [Paenibacillus nanensis]